MNIKGAEKMTAVYWFAILLVVAGAIAYMVFVFYGKPYSVSNAESKILENKIADCLAGGGYLNEEIAFGLNNDNFLDRCNLNFETEDVFDWKDKGQYYAEVNIYNFNQNLKEGYAGTQISNVVVGNKNLVEEKLNLEEKLSESIRIDVYQPGFGKGYTSENGGLVTTCNLWARDFLDMRSKNVGVRKGVTMGGLIDFEDYDIRCLNPNESIEKVIVSTPIPVAFENAIEAVKSGIIKELNAEEAQKLANEGIVVWIISVEPRHEAIVSPDLKNVYDEKKGPKIAQTGGKPGIMYISNSYAWGSNWKDYDIRFYVFPKYGEKIISEGVLEEITLNKLNSFARSFYVLDKANNKYVIEILANVGKSEKNE